MGSGSITGSPRAANGAASITVTNGTAVLKESWKICGKLLTWCHFPGSIFLVSRKRQTREIIMTLAEIVGALKLDACESWCNGYVVVRNLDGSVARIDCDCGARSGLLTDAYQPH